MSVSAAWLRESVWGRKKKKESNQEIESERKRHADSSDCSTSEDPLEAYFYQAPLTEVAKSLNAPPDLSNSRAQEPLLSSEEWTGDAPFLWSSALISAAHMKTAEIAAPIQHWWGTRVDKWLARTPETSRPRVRAKRCILFRHAFFSLIQKTEVFMFNALYCNRTHLNDVSTEHTTHSKP